MRIAYAFILTSTLALGCGDDGGKTTTDDSTDPTNGATTGTGGVETGTTGGTTGEPTTVTPTTGPDETTGPAPTTGPGETTDDTTGPGETTSSTTGPVELLNGCDPASAEDHTADPETIVTQEGLMYSPKCIRIAAGSSVKFVSNFAAHPLVGGEVVDGVKSPDPGSPVTMTNMGMEASFTFADAGDYGYYCDIHGSGGMNGAIFVQ